MPDALHDFVEEFALVFEATGTPRIAARILGWLMVCDPPEQSATQLAQTLGASKASISTMIRVLTQGMLIERVPKRGSRQDFYRIRPGAWTDLTVKRLSALSIYTQLAERGLELMATAPPEQRTRLEEMRDLFGFFERELRGMVERLEERKQPSKSRVRVG
ncbi:MarR family transcriptional regulator [uncultured Meiothermus sp.]|jgi:DNA-binding transcriptional regulator GbsR (MarR family)|uniref:GbsR/MarR family transcriptional regulator n=1 Tax=uncultured Meiothermus sp. TaxID=157471 RepID=UPI002613CFE9|nr:MarR family transcriptional regulator [uncultured Meiothermus sp.]